MNIPLTLLTIVAFTLAVTGHIELFVAIVVVGMFFYSWREGRETSRRAKTSKPKVVIKAPPPRYDIEKSQLALKRAGLSLDLNVTERDVQILNGFTNRDSELAKLRMELDSERRKNVYLQSDAERWQSFSSSIANAVSSNMPTTQGVMTHGKKQKVEGQTQIPDSLKHKRSARR